MSAVLRCGALVLVAGLAVQAAPMGTCDVQRNCIKVAMGPATSAACASRSPCAWRVCVMLDLDSTDPVCAKGSGTVSHTCKKSDGTCGGGNWSSAVEMSGLPDDFNMCQTGVPGSTLQFLLKDGNGCKGSQAALAISGAGSSATMQCAPSTTKTCTGNGIGVECIWSVTLPAVCPAASPSPRPSPLGSPSASPAVGLANGIGSGAVANDSGALLDMGIAGSGDIAMPTIGDTSDSGANADVVLGDAGLVAGDSTLADGAMVDIAAGSDCTLLEEMVPKRLLAFHSDGIPTCDINGALSLLGPQYNCQRPSSSCQFLQCSQPIPDETLAELRSMQC